MLAAASGRLREGRRDGRAGAGGLDDLVDDTDLDRPRQTAREPVVLVGELLLDLGDLRLVDLGEPAAVQETVDRDGLWLAQTPQLFPAHALREALQAAKEQGFVVTDEASAMELAGSQALLILGSARNFKVTWPEDFELMEKWL